MAAGISFDAEKEIIIENIVAGQCGWNGLQLRPCFSI
jgi:hypothetical protein